jgi:hypothetical protein
MSYSKLSPVPGMLGDGETKPSVSTAVSDVVNSGAFKTVSTVASIYHGYRRNDSVLWALAWGLASRIAPLVTPTVAAAQGYGRRKGG